MGMPCKEELYQLEQIARRQVQVFPDACDIGIRIDGDRNPSERAMIRKFIQDMACCQEQVIEYKEGKKWRFWLPIEIDDGREHGMAVSISYFKRRYKKVEYLSIYMKREARPCQST